MKKLSVKQSLFAESILAGSTIAEAAAQAGVGPTICYSWLNKGLREWLTERRKEKFEAGLNKLETNLTAAVDALAGMMTDTETPPAQRLGAAKTVIEQTIKLFELRDIESRITALEQQAAGGAS
jgi:transposase-like protein